MSKERKPQQQAENLPNLSQSKSKNYFFSPAKDFHHQDSHHQSRNGQTQSSDKGHFEDYLKAKFEKQMLLEQTMQNKSSNGYANTMNTTMAQKIIEKIFVNSPTKKVSSQQINPNTLSSQFFHKQGVNQSTKFTLQSMLINNQIGSTQQKNGLISQLNINSPVKNSQIQFQQDDDQMKIKLKHDQWTSTVDLQNLRSQGNVLSNTSSKCVSPTKLRVSMPLVEEIQQISQQQQMQNQKRNPATVQKNKQLQELSKVNKQLQKMKHVKTNSLHFLPSNTYIQSALNSCQNIGTTASINSNQGSRSKIQKQKNNNQDISICSSITHIPNNKKVKDPSLDDINWNLGEDMRSRNKSLNFPSSPNTNTHTLTNINASQNNQYTSTLNQINSTRKDLNNEEEKIQQKQQQEQQSQQYLISKPRPGKVINLRDTKSNTQQKDSPYLSYFQLNSPKDEIQETESSKRQNTEITSLHQIEAQSKSETLIEPIKNLKKKVNQLKLQIPKKIGFSSMMEFDVQEEEIEETLGSKSFPKSVIMKNIKDNIMYEDSHQTNESLNHSRDDMDFSNANKNNKPNCHQQLFKSKSNFIFFGKTPNSNSGQQSGQQSPVSGSPLSTYMTPQEQTKNIFKLQLKAQSPTNNRKEMLIQQIFIQKQKSKQHQSTNLSYQSSALHSPHRRLSPQKQYDHLPSLNLNNNTINNSQPNQISPQSQGLNPDIAPPQNTNNPYVLNLDLLRSSSLPQNQLLDQNSSKIISNQNTPKQQTSNPQQQVQFSASSSSGFNRTRQASSIEFSVNGGYHSNQGLLNTILKKSIKNFSKNINYVQSQINSHNNNVAQNINIQTLNSSNNSQFSNSPVNRTPVRSQQKKKTKINTNSYLELDTVKQSFSNMMPNSPQYESSPSVSQNNTILQESMNKRMSYSIQTNQLRFKIDEVCQGLEMYIINDVELMRELKQNETESSQFAFYISKYLQLAQHELANSAIIRQRDKLVLFKINTKLFEKVKTILSIKMVDMKIEKGIQDKIMKFFEDSKQHIIANNVFEEIGSKKQLKQLIQKVVQQIKDNTNIPILNQFSDQKAMIENATNFFMFLFKGDYEQVGNLSHSFLEKNFNVTLIEFFLLKNFTYNTLLKDQSLIKEVILRILEKIESVRSSLVPNYDDNIIFNSEQRIQSLLFDLGIHSISVHKFIKPLKNKILPESQYDPFSYYLKQEVKYLVTNPKLRKMARMVDANLKSKEDFYKVSYNFLDILKKQKSIKFTSNQLLNVEVRILKVAILLGLEEDYLGLFKDITEIEKQLLEEIDQYHQQNSMKLSIQNMKASLDIKFLSLIIEFTFNQYSVFNAYDISIAKKFYSLNSDIINTQISSLENLLLKKKNESIHFIQIQQKIPQFISLLKKIFIST